MPYVMQTYISRLSGNFVASCPNCGSEVAYWDDDDLDENGNLTCYCNYPKEGH